MSYKYDIYTDKCVHVPETNDRIDCVPKVELTDECIDEIVKRLTLSQISDDTQLPHGHWERPVDAYTKKSYKWKCSVCGEIAYARPVVCLSAEQQKCTYKYCPNCGAQMETEDGKIN